MRELLKFKKYAFKIFEPGTYLGEEEIFFNTNRKFYLKAATDVELMILNREDFEKVFKTEFPHIKKRLH